METPFSWLLEADEIENVPQSQKTEESHARAQILRNKVACCQRPKKRLCYLLNERGDLSFSRINALFEPLYLCCRTQKRNCVWEKIKIIKRTEHVGITCADEITSSSQSRTRGIFCPVSFKRCACAISKNYVLSFDHTLNTARGKSLRFCAKKLDGSLKRIISFNNNTSLF